MDQFRTGSQCVGPESDPLEPGLTLSHCGESDLQPLRLAHHIWISLFINFLL